MTPQLTGATRLYIIIGDPIAQVKSPGGMTAGFAARGHEGIMVPVQVKPEVQPVTAVQAVQHLAEDIGGITLYPPVPTPVQRVANVERAQLMIESPMRPALQRFLAQSQAVWLELAKQNRRSGLIRWAVDVDPLSI